MQWTRHGAMPEHPAGKEFLQGAATPLLEQHRAGSASDPSADLRRLRRVPRQDPRCSLRPHGRDGFGLPALRLPTPLPGAHTLPGSASARGQGRGSGLCRKQLLWTLMCRAAKQGEAWARALAPAAGGHRARDAPGWAHSHALPFPPASRSFGGCCTALSKRSLTNEG